MAYCNGYILNGTKKHQKEVVFSSGSQFSYIPLSIVTKLPFKMMRYDLSRKGQPMFGQPQKIPGSVDVLVKLKSFVGQVTLEVVEATSDCYM